MTNPTLHRILEAAARPVDASGLAAFRVLFGLLCAVSAGRFLVYGWVERFFGQPTFFFPYWGFEWIRPMGVGGMTAAFAAMVVLGLMVSAGLMYRVSCAALVVIFTYVELTDVTNYLNHYYLLSLLGALMVLAPAHRFASLDARLRPGLSSPTHPAWWTWLLRGQVGAVYVGAGLAKLGEDWLVHAQPLNIWLISRSDLPVVGAWFTDWRLALAMSWGGFLFDTFIVAFLLWPRTRALAYLVVLGFHASTGALFTIGMFPWIMICAATVFFDPGWARGLLARVNPDLARAPGAGAPSARARRLAPWALAAVVAWTSVQVLVPRRAALYGGDVLWHEQGMRWSWRVMVREKNGSISYRVRWRGRAREQIVPPSRYLTSHQEREMSGQPDLILKLAHVIGRDLEAQGKQDVEVRVDALVSLNGRPARPLIDPDVDLMTIDDTLDDADWILPAPTSPPPYLGANTPDDR